VVRNRKMAAAGRITFSILFFLIFTSFTLPRRSGVEN
jgi:DMSO/TMAO reductase YedYZ heme-binding membrane subunit